MTYDTIEKIKAADAFFFAPDAMRFFGGRVMSQVFVGSTNTYFVTSEKSDDINARMYTVRSCDRVTGQISTIGKYQQWKSRSGALKAAERYARDELKVAARAPRITHELQVCVQCMLHAQNGECGTCRDCMAWPEELDQNEPRPWALWTGQGSRYMAMSAHEHQDYCTEEDRQENCDCGEVPFAVFDCQGCGRRVAGSCYDFVRFDR